MGSITSLDMPMHFLHHGFQTPQFLKQGPVSILATGHWVGIDVVKEIDAVRTAILAGGGESPGGRDARVLTFVSPSLWVLGRLRA